MAVAEDIMADLEIINTGDQPNDGTGDSIYTAFNKINSNFATVVGLLGSSAFSFLRLTEAPTSFIASNTSGGFVTVLGINNDGDKIVNKVMSAGTGIHFDLTDDNIVIKAGSFGTTATFTGGDLDAGGLYNLRNIRPAEPQNDYDAVHRKWVYDTFVSRSGVAFYGTGTTSSTVFGNIKLIATPVHDQHIVNKIYVDTKLEETIVPDLPSTYDLGSPTRPYRNVYANNYNGAITTATRLATPRLISLGGHLSGAALFDGSANVTINTVVSNATSTNVSNYIVKRDAYGNFSAGRITCIATSAEFADLAEKYTSDADYEPGTVVVFGGEKEVTIARDYQDTRIAGVVSTNPAYLMNNEADGVAVALQGRVPVKVVGTIRKGDLLVSSGAPGVATVGVNPKMGSVIGKAIENYDSQRVGVIEAVVGRL